MSPCCAEMVMVVSQSDKMRMLSDFRYSVPPNPLMMTSLAIPAAEDSWEKYGEDMGSRAARSGR